MLRGIERVCGLAGIAPDEIDHVMHGTTVATNTVLTGTGARVGLVTTKGYRQVLQIARSFVPGGLGGWVIYNKSLPMAPLALTIEANERIGARGDVVAPLDEAGAAREPARRSASKDIEALTVSLINAFANDAHERRIRDDRAGGAARHSGFAVLGGRAGDAGVRAHGDDGRQFLRAPAACRSTSATCRQKLDAKAQQREAAHPALGRRARVGAIGRGFPVNLLMSGPAGGVTGALWVAVQAGFPNLLTFDMGGTSTDVALIMNGEPRLRRETTVGDVTVRASSVDIRTVGAGGGSIAHVPELTGALRVGPQSAGADPGTGGLRQGRRRADGDRRERRARLSARAAAPRRRHGARPRARHAGGGEDRARRSARRVKDAAQGIYDIVNENMVGALRLVSVEQGHDPRDFALIAFGGAGPLHANALSRLLGSWPVDHPAGSGRALRAWRRDDGACATRRRAPSSASSRETNADEIAKHLRRRSPTTAAKALAAREGRRPRRWSSATRSTCAITGRGCGSRSTSTSKRLEKRRARRRSREPFDAEHTRLFTFALPLEHEFVALRAVVQGKGVTIKRQVIARRAAATRRPRPSAGRRPTWTARDVRGDGLRPREAQGRQPASRAPRS